MVYWVEKSFVLPHLSHLVLLITEPVQFTYMLLGGLKRYGVWTEKLLWVLETLLLHVITTDVFVRTQGSESLFRK